MRLVLFCHSLLSDWNHGNAHFLRGIVTELHARGHEVSVYEPVNAWSVENLKQELGELPIAELREHYPDLDVVRYDHSLELDLDRALQGADVVIVHEWNTPHLVRALGRHRVRAGGRYKLLFHDTHHRSASDKGSIDALDLSGYDAVLAFGEAVRERYVKAGWSRRAYTWHEAADVRVFRPRPEIPRTEELIWIGNWGDEERTQELSEFLLDPVKALGLKATVYGVRYPARGRSALEDAGMKYAGYTPNYRVPQLFAAHRVTVHVPRRPYVKLLPGIPTIRVFEALACGIPLVSAPWEDSESLFRPSDFVRVTDGKSMRRALETLLSDRAAASEVAASGLETVLERHTCAQRVRELFAVIAELGSTQPSKAHPIPQEAAGWD